MSDTPAPPKPAPRKRRRWPWRALAVVALLAAAVWFAPAVVANTGLRNAIARSALADLKGTVTVGGATLGWLSPVELRDVTVTDAAGRTLLTVPKVTSSRTLLALARDRSDLGEFAVHQPAADVVAEGATTNLEDALAAYLKPDGTPPAADRPAVAVKVDGAKLTLRDAGSATVFEGVTAAVTVPRSRNEAVAVSATGRTAAGTFDLTLSAGETGSVAVKADGLPLDALAPFVRRAAPGLSVGGALTCDLAATWGGSAARVSGSAAAANLDVAAPWLNCDRLRLASVTAGKGRPFAVSVSGSAVTVESAVLACDVGTLSAAGSFDPNDSLDRVTDRAGVHVEADVDLAKLATLLPRLLRVREGTAVQGGRLTAGLTSRVGPAGVVWEGNVRTSALKGTRDGKPLEWAEPLSAEFAARITPDGSPTFDKLVVLSDFVAVNARGSAESFQAAANVYLDRLAQRLGEFVELGGVKLDGEATVRVRAARAPAGDFKADAAVELKQFVIADAGGHGLREPALTLSINLAGKDPPGQPVRIDAAMFAVHAGPDALELRLTEPVADVKQLAVGKASASLSGDLARWRSRLGGFVPFPPDWQFGGTGTATAAVRFEPGRLVADNVKVTVDGVTVRGPGLDLADPRLTAEGTVSVARDSGATEVINLKLNGTPFTFTSPKLGFTPQPSGDLAIDGTGMVSADLSGVQRMLKLPGDALSGRGTGNVKFRAAGGKTDFTADGAVKGFVYGPPQAPTWAEPTLMLAADGEFDPAAGAVTLRGLRAGRDGLSLDGRGAVTKISSTQDVRLDGNLTYDLAKLNPQFRQVLGGGFEASGSGLRPFTVSGSLAPGGAVAVAVAPSAPRPSGPVTLRPPSSPTPPPAATLAGLTGKASVGWQQVKAYGFDVGPADLTATLSRGVVAFSTVDATFGGGKVRLTPTVRLEPGPVEMTFAKGKVVERAKLTPQACASAIGFALPAIANAGQAEGELSLTLDDNRVPLSDPYQSAAKGQLHIHRATVSAGPLATEIAKLFGAAGTTVTLATETTVPVRVEGGRVHHENLALTVNGFTVKTTGSVGFDTGMSLVADVPIPASLFKNNPKLGTVLANRVVKVPVGGTLAKPAIDGRAFQNEVGRLVQGAAKDLGRDFLKDKLDAELNKFLPQPPKKP